MFSMAFLLQYLLTGIILVLWKKSSSMMKIPDNGLLKHCYYYYLYCMFEKMSANTKLCNSEWFIRSRLTFLYFFCFIFICPLSLFSQLVSPHPPSFRKLGDQFVVFFLLSLTFCGNFSQEVSRFKSEQHENVYCKLLYKTVSLYRVNVP